MVLDVPKRKICKIFEDKERGATYQSGEQFQSQVKPKCKTVSQNLGWESPRLRFFYIMMTGHNNELAILAFHTVFFQSDHN